MAATMRRSSASPQYLNTQTWPWRMAAAAAAPPTLPRSLRRGFVAQPKPGKINGFGSPSGPPGDKNWPTLTLPANAGKLS